MFIAVYRWKLKEGQEEKFREGWRRRTEEIYRKCGSLGSRLHRADDGTWVAYAQWPDRRDWEAARQVAITDTQAPALMKESVEASYPEMLLEVTDDLIALRRFSEPEK
ncbi:MAG TPA: antibiotic biosynthesis monooxygenase [Pyrinomonadaceae bacterium]